MIDNIFLQNDFLSPEECQAWIAKSEEIGYEKAGISRGQQQMVNLKVRNNDRVIYDSKELAKSLYKRSKDILYDDFPDSFLIGLNERLRFYRYGVSQEFKPHQDLSYQRNKNVWSEFTFLIYLNDDYEGGETKFNDCIVEPKTGMLLVFKHELLHEGAKVEQGIKYVLRSDVMYRRRT
jgi:predicted 2-oxoglutarate/Fe(II)-dependent dioxygenase YbiX